MSGSLFKNLFKKEKQNTDIPRKKSVEHYLMDAIEAFENGEFSDAANQFGLIAQVDPEHPLAHIMQARAYIELKEYRNAIDALFNHLRIVPNSVEALILLGLSYYETGNLANAEERFEQALNLKSDSVLVKENLAITKLATGDLQKGLDELITLHNREPENRAVVELIVITLGKLGKWDAAKQYAHMMKT